MNWLLDAENQQTRLLGKGNSEVEYLKVLDKPFVRPLGRGKRDLNKDVVWDSLAVAGTSVFEQETYPRTAKHARDGRHVTAQGNRS